MFPKRPGKERTELKSSVKNGRFVTELKIPVRFTLNLKNLVGNRAPWDNNAKKEAKEIIPKIKNEKNEPGKQGAGRRSALFIRLQ